MLKIERILFSLLLCLAMRGFSVAEEPAAASPPPDAATIQKWIAELDGESYEQREQVMLKLENGGPEAAHALGAAVAGDRLEITARGIRILQNMYLSANDATSDAAETALEQLTASSNRSASRRALAGLNTQGLRQRRALAKIAELGGSSEVVATMTGPSGSPFVAKVSLLRNWKGGDAGLKYVQKISDLRHLWVIEGSGVTIEALEKLQRELPNLDIVHRGPAMLGVIGTQGDVGLYVSTVADDTPADRAGIQMGDIIVKFNGRPIKNFESLVELTKKTLPGDEIPVEILRGEDKTTQKKGTTLNLKVKMGEWK